MEKTGSNGNISVELPAQDAGLLALYYQDPVPNVGATALEMQNALSKKLRGAVAGRERDPSVRLEFDWLDPLDRASAILLLVVTQGLAKHYEESAKNLEIGYGRVHKAALVCGNMSFTASVNDFRVMAYCLEDCVPLTLFGHDLNPARLLAKKLKAAIEGRSDYGQAKLVFDVCDRSELESLMLLAVADRVLAGRMAKTAEALESIIPSGQIPA